MHYPQRLMADESNEDTRKTQPKRGDPIEIPIPTQIARDFSRVALAEPADEEE